MATIKAAVKDKLVWNAFEWKKWWSMRFTIISTIFSTITVAWMALPYDWTYSVPDWIKMGLVFGSLSTSLAAGVARVVKQGNTTTGGS